MFAHGYGGFDSRFYGEILQHAASRGYVAVFVPYPISLDFAHCIAQWIAVLCKLFGGIRI
jgi:hypothetical protein